MRSAWWCITGCLLVAVAFSLAVLPTLAGATLRLDRGFGKGGIARAPFRLGSEREVGGALRPIRQPDGKVLVAAGINLGNRYDPAEFALARFKPNGEPDASFGRRGRVLLRRWNFVPQSLQVQQDGRIIMLGWAGQMPGFSGTFPNQIGLLRLLRDGSRDRSFGTHGLVAWNPPYRADTNSMQVNPAVLVQQADGRLLVGGLVSEGRLVQDPSSIVSVNWLAFARFNQDGSLDQSFGDAGVVEDHFDGWQFGPPFFGAWATLPDGNIVALDSRHEGPASSLESTSWWLDRFAADGRPDHGFGDNGSLRLGLHVLDAASDLLVARDGSLVIVGAVGLGQPYDPAVAIRRILPGGQLDDQFGTTCAAPPLHAGSAGAAVTPDGGVLATAATLRSVRNRPSLARTGFVIPYGPDGCAAARPLRVRGVSVGPPLLRGSHRALIGATSDHTLALIRIRR